MAACTDSAGALSLVRVALARNALWPRASESWLRARRRTGEYLATDNLRKGSRACGPHREIRDVDRGSSAHSVFHLATLRPRRDGVRSDPWRNFLDLSDSAERYRPCPSGSRDRDEHRERSGGAVGAFGNCSPRAPEDLLGSSCSGTSACRRNAHRQPRCVVECTCLPLLVSMASLRA